MQRKINLQYIAELMDAEGTPGVLYGKTEAEQHYYAWEDEFVKDHSNEEFHKMQQAVLGYAYACELAGREDGLKLGARLVLELLNARKKWYITNRPDTEIEPIDMASEAVALFTKLTPANQDIIIEYVKMLVALDESVKA